MPNLFLSDYTPLLAQADATQDTSVPPGSPVDAQTGGATTTAPAGTGTGIEGDPGAQPTSPFGGMLPLLILMMVTIMLVSMLSGRKEKKKKAELLSQLGKGSVVQTVGGIRGTVVEVRDATDEVVVKVDEKSNTSLRFARSSIVSVTQDS